MSSYLKYEQTTLPPGLGDNELYVVVCVSNARIQEYEVEN